MTTFIGNPHCGLTVGQRVSAPCSAVGRRIPGTIHSLDRYLAVTVRFDGVPYPQHGIPATACREVEA